MAIRFDLKKFEAIKQNYLNYIKSGKCTADMLQYFATYKLYLDADKEIREIIQTVKSQKEAERKRNAEQKKQCRNASPS